MKRFPVRRAALAVAAAPLLPLVVGCSQVRTVKANFAGDFNCREDEVDVWETAPGRYHATGCDAGAVYQCVNYGPYNAQTQCSLEMIENRSPPPPAAAPAARRAGPPEAKVAKLKSGKSTVRVEMNLDSTTLLKLFASPGGRSKKISLRLVMRQGPQSPQSHPGSIFGSPSSAEKEEGEAAKEERCELDWLINGQRTQGPSVKMSREDNITTYRAVLPTLFGRELSIAHKVALRLCDRKWTLRPEQILEMRHFFDLYEDEMAWQDKPRKGGTGGLVAPTGGWPEWGTPDTATMKAAASGDALGASALFKQLERSVYKVEASLPAGTSQGSAVAVTPSELLTNCHVVEHARKITLKRAKQELVATLQRSDPASDRCVLTVGATSLEPVVGVRTWESLEIGEPLYALGSPAGLELSLSDGILSGRREEKAMKFVQTTAPISPGSSGGGLFDARGNLVGITTLVLAGRERLNQALNFAIPAQRFFEP